MYTNFRYHIFTITAIFAALGLGILIGSSIIGNEGLLEEQRKLIDNIGSDIRKLREENLRLRDGIGQLELKLASREDLEKGLISFIVGDMVDGKNYYLYSEQELDSKLKEGAAAILKLAGASLSFLDKEEEIHQVLNSRTESRVILLNCSRASLDRLITESVEDRFFIYQENNLNGLLPALLGDEMDEKPETGLHNNPGIQ